jgi:pimeloyl-ACP methyl ester carboxylesterase
MRVRPLVVAVTTLAALATAIPAHAQPTLQPRTCERGLAKGTKCSTLTVPLDRTGATPGTIALPVRVLRAKGSGPRRGPLMMLAGGPGQAGIADADYNELFAELAPGYDLVSFDQRGTGASALRCPALQDQVTEPGTDPVDGAADLITRQFGACAVQLGDARNFYTSAASAADIDDLRAALGVEQITLGGTSYGTWVTQVYARMFPTRVQRLVFDSVVGPEGVTGIALSEYAGARRVVRDQCDGSACRGITRDPVGDTTKLAKKLDATAMRGRLVLPNGRVRRTAIGGPKEPGTVSSVLYAGDLDPYVRAAFPAAVASALRGDAALLMRIAAAAGGDDDGDDPKEYSIGLYAATTCAESVLPWPATAPADQRRAALDAAIAAIPADRLAPWNPTTVRASAALAGCLEWPGAAFAAAPTGPLPDVPALVLNGLDDVRTPVEDAEAVARLLPRSTVVRIPNQGHSTFRQECSRDAFARFLAGRTVSTRACRGKRTPDSVANVAVPPRSLSAVGPRGDSARANAQRSAQAVRLSIRDAGLAVSLYDESPRAPGLRAGTAAVRETDDRAVLDLRNYGYVPGLRLTGQVVLGERWSGTLRVSGARSTARGTLTIRDGVARGRLGGVRVSLRLQGS